jgi:hypothetical protein
MADLQAARELIATYDAALSNPKTRAADVRLRLASATAMAKVLVDELEHARAALLAALGKPEDAPAVDDKPGEVRTWRCYGHVHGSKYLGEVKARSAKEAQDKAFELEECHVSLCHQCTGDCEDPTIEEINVEAADE